MRSRRTSPDGRWRRLAAVDPASVTSASGGDEAAGWRLAPAGGLEWLTCDALAALPGLVHAFTTRRGGVSAPPFDTLNLGLHVGDDAGAVHANRARLAAALDLEAAAFVFAAQVHGRAVAVVGAADRGRGADDAATAMPGCDGLATAAPGVALVVLAADCATVVLADPVRRTAAAVHAGWRGTVAGAAGAAVAALVDLGSRPSDLRAAIGPAIGAADYAVGADVVDAVRARWPGDAGRWLAAGPSGPTFDLAGANRDQLVAAGLAADRVWACGHSTAADRGRWYSHRAEGGRTGRQAAVIAWRHGVA